MISLRKITSVVIVVLLLLFVSSGCPSVFGKDDTDSARVCFFDNATFENFSDEKLEQFILDEETTVKFTFEGKVDAGELLIKVYNESGETIYETENLSYHDSFTRTLSPGTYNYLFRLVNCENGQVYNKAEISHE